MSIFPTISHISDVLPFIDGVDGFIVMDKSYGKVVEYTHMAAETFAGDPKESLSAQVRLECRGLVFDNNGDLVSRPFHKFFNLGERENTLQSNIDWSRPHLVMPKLDGCFHNSSRIKFCDGSVRKISEVIKKKMEGPIWGRNPDGDIVPVKIIGWSKKSSTKDWRTITVNTGQRVHKLRITGNHKCFVDGKWMEAKDIKKGMMFSAMAPSFCKNQADVLMGTLMGDSCIVNTQANNPNIGSSLTIQGCQKLAHKEYCELKSSILTKTGTLYDAVSGYGAQTVQYRIFESKKTRPYFEKLFKTGKKRITRDWIESLSPLGLAFWYMDDGSMSKGAVGQRPRAILHVEGLCEESQNDIFDYFVEVWGFSPSMQTYKNKYRCIRLNADDAFIFWEAISHYMIEIMAYKIPEEFHKNITTSEHLSSLVNKDFVSERLWKIENVEHGLGSQFGSGGARYDIQTETGNFYCNDLLVHNSMIRSLYLEEGFRLGTRAGVTGHSCWAEDYMVSRTDIDYREFMDKMEDHGITPCFEFFSRQNMIVLDYGSSFLKLLACRVKTTGEYMDYDEMVEEAEKFNVPVVKQIKVDLSDPSEFLAMAKQEKDAEGYVIRFNDGQTVKVKNDWYVHLHHIVSGLNAERNIVRHLLDNDLDDILPILPQNRKKELEKFSNDFWKFYSRFKKDIHVMWANVWENMPSEYTRKDLALEIQKQEKEYQGILFRFIDADEESRDKVIRDVIYKACNKEISFAKFIDFAGFKIENNK